MRALLLLGVFAVANAVAEPDKDEPRGVRQLAIDVVLVDSVAEVEALHLAFVGPVKDGNLEGFAGKGTRPDGTPVCVIVAVRPGKRWTDSRTLVLGHELRHCLGEQHD